jgi:hypothetical protein
MLRLLLLFAMLIAPLGMAPVAARQTVTSAMPMQHCPEHAPNHGGKAGFGECAMACSAALPAIPPPHHEPLVAGHSRYAAACIAKLSGIHPAIATPPPRIL